VRNNSFRPVRLAAATAALVAALVAGPAGVAGAAPPDPNLLSEFRATAHFDAAAGQIPENLVVGPDGSAYVTFIGSRQVARVGADGAVTVLATLPLPDDGGAGTPLAGAAVPTGIDRTSDGTLYVAYAAGDSRFTGLWRLRPGGTPQRIAALPADSFPNGIDVDETSGTVYIADSVLGTVWQAPVSGGPASPWAAGPALERTAFAGANGLKVHRRAVWVTNTDMGTLLRIPIRGNASAGPIQTRAHGLAGVDDFAFTGRGDQALAALFGTSELALVDAGSRSTAVLDEGDGLQNPTAVAVQGTTVVISSSARQTGTNPNLVTARLLRR